MLIEHFYWETFTINWLYLLLWLLYQVTPVWTLFCFRAFIYYSSFKFFVQSFSQKLLRDPGLYHTEDPYEEESCEHWSLMETWIKHIFRRAISTNEKCHSEWSQKSAISVTWRQVTSFQFLYIKVVRTEFWYFRQLQHFS